MPVNSATTSPVVRRTVLDTSPVGRAAPAASVTTSSRAAASDDVFAGSSSSGSAASFNPLDPFGVAQFWLSYANPFTVAQNLMLASQIAVRGPFGGPFYMGPFY